MVTMATPRYTPWLQKALRVQQETEAFWGRESPRQLSPHSRQERERDANVGQRRGGGGDGSPPTRLALWGAVAEDDDAHVKRVLDVSPARVFERRETVKDGGGGATLLHEAAFHGSANACRLLLQHVEAGCPGTALRMFVGSTDTVNSKTTPLIAACQGAKGDVKRRLEIVQLLVHAGADVEHQDAHGDNAIHWCARTANNVLLRWLLKATDAGANAVFAENFKRETPLDIAKRRLARADSGSFSAQSVLHSLHSVDRKCNVRLKMQVIKRHMETVESERAAAQNAQWANALAAADDAVHQADRMWSEALRRAEENRSDAEKAYVTTAAEAARLEAIQWLTTKDGTNYLKAQLGITTDELKVEILRGTIAKPKDLKKAALQRASEAFISHQEETARKAAHEGFRAQRPLYPHEPEKLRSILPS